MTAHAHRFAVGLVMLFIMGAVGLYALYLAVTIRWAELQGAEAGIVSSIITAVVTGTIGLTGPVVGYYFGSSPPADHPPGAPPGG